MFHKLVMLIGFMAFTFPVVYGIVHSLFHFLTRNQKEVHKEHKRVSEHHAKHFHFNYEKEHENA